MPSTTSLAMTGTLFLARTPSSATVYQDGDLDYLVFSARSRMYILQRTADELFTDFVDREGKARGLDVVVNGNNYDVDRIGLGLATFHSTVPAQRTTPLGQLIENQRYLAGTSQPQRFYVAQGLGPVYPFWFGFGDPPTTGSQVAIGGLGPLILNRLKYGDGNLYKAGTPAAAPTTGEPPAAYAPNLIQRNNETFKSFASRGPRCGKTVIAHASSADKVVVFHQPDGAATGITLDDLRDKLFDVGVDNAVFLDGSDSAMLFANFDWYTKPGGRKDRTNTIGVAFDIVR